MNIIKSFYRYAHVVYIIARMSQMRAFEYRIDYIFRLVRTFVDVGAAVITISVFYAYTSTIAGWSKWEALVVFGIFQGVSSLVFVFFGIGITDLPVNIVSGKLDTFLTKPIDAQFLSSTSLTFITNIFRSLFGFSLAIYALTQLPYPIGLVNLTTGLLGIVSGMVIYFCITFLASESAFWSQSTELNELAYTIASISRFPVDYFSRFKELFYYIPLAFIATVPALAFLGKNYLYALGSPIVAIVLLWIVRRVWFAGLKAYQSASS